ncbi:XRE family transcriptional regulator [Chloroflexia bacterium SDU3-3]|nr:XRE family transcriptional regulator [Chloroflexia bacterium SDU3-3]
MTATIPFGRWLQQQRKKLDLTQAELAQQAGCALGTLRNIETGSARPSKQLAARLAMVLGGEQEQVAAIVAFARGTGPAPAVLPAANARHGAPTHLTGMIGRERELAELRGMLLRPDVRLVTLTGPGGTGKTRVAVESIALLESSFPGGVWFVDLAPVSDPALVLAAIAQAVALPRGAGPLLAQLAEALRGDAALLLLDNFEQVVDGGADVAALLGACPRLKALTTSRIALGLMGEHELPIPPLGLPDRARLPPLPQLTQYEAIRLFRARARAARPSFEITAENAAAVAEICYQLDGLPLAIELAAARIKLFPPQALLAKLDRRLAFLTGGRDRPSRQQTIRSTIEWSYRLLAPDERRMFQKIGVFSGGATLDMIAEVCAEPQAQVDAIVFALVSHSLLYVLPPRSDSPEINPRIGMLETIREFALERLDAGDESAPTRRRHARAYAAMVRQGQPQLLGPEQAAWLRRLNIEHDNIRVALAWLLRDDAAQALAMAGELADFWKVRSLFEEGRRWLDAALEASVALPLDRTRIHALHGALMMAVDQADVPRATDLAEQHVAAARALGDPRYLAESLAEMAQLAYTVGRLDRAEELFREALADFRALGNRERVANMLLNIGRIVGVHRCDAAVATPLLSESLAIYEQIGYPLGVAMASLCLASTAIHTGDIAQVQRLGRQALGLAWELGNQVQIAFNLTTQAVVSIHAGDPAQAARFYAAAEAIFSAVAMPLSPSEQATHDRWRAEVVAALDGRQAAAAWAEGGSAPLAQIVAEALGHSQQRTARG